MYYANCEWYVDMGEHNKPLCERKGLRPAKCGECPVYIRSIEKENAKLRELVREMYGATLVSCGECWVGKAFDPAECDNENCGHRKNYLAMRELRIEVDE